MPDLTPQQRMDLSATLTAKRQKHAELDEAIHMMQSVGSSDAMMISRMKKKKLKIKDEIVELEDILMPDIIA